MQIIPIKVPYPKEFGSGEATNAYLLKGDRNILIDTGVDSTENRAFIKAALTNEGAWGPDAILITHGHHDHFGLAFYIQKETGCSIMISESDSLALKNYAAFTLARFDDIFRLCVDGGYSDKEFEEIREMLTVGADFVPKPRMYAAFRELELEIEVAKPLKAVSLPGHTKGTIGYAFEDAIFCGDAVMGEKANVENLSNELASLTKLEVFQKIYPGHKKFPMEAKDIREIRGYLIGKSEETLQMTAEGITLKALVDRLYGEINEKNFAKRLVPLKQVISYLRYLEGKGQVKNENGKWWKT